MKFGETSHFCVNRLAGYFKQALLVRGPGHTRPNCDLPRNQGRSGAVLSITCITDTVIDLNPAPVRTNIDIYDQVNYLTN